MLRRKGDLKWRRHAEDIPALAFLQQELLRGAFSALQPGGVLLYSACTCEPEETTVVIKSFLNSEPAASLSLLAPLLPPALREEEKEEGMLSLWPHRHGLDGIASIRKRAAFNLSPAPDCQDYGSARFVTLLFPFVCYTYPETLVGEDNATI